MTHLKPQGESILRTALEKVAQTLPGCQLSVSNPTSILFSSAAGSFDPLEPERQASKVDILWFASTTKLLTSICYLQLVDRGVLDLDTRIADYYSPLDKLSKQILIGFGDDGRPRFKENKKDITLRMMLNQSSGFGKEFGDVIPLWKKVTTKGKGFVNSCKVENLIHTPIIYEPGTIFEYGNSAEWLGLILPEIVKESTEEYLQKNVLRPLGMTGTTFYPFGPAFEDKLMPLRWGLESEVGKGIKWEELNGQMDLLTLPRTREEIEYPVAGGGIYSRSSDYILVLQHLLRHYLSISDSSISPPPSPLLSDTSVKSLFHGILPESAYESMVHMFNAARGLGEDDALHPGEADWSTGMAVYQPKDGRRRGGWGRRKGSVGWGGAAGTDYWIDPESHIACVFTTQMLPGRHPHIIKAKEEIEKAVYEALAV